MRKSINSYLQFNPSSAAEETPRSSHCPAVLPTILSCLRLPQRIEEHSLLRTVRTQPAHAALYLTPRVSPCCEARLHLHPFEPLKFHVLAAKSQYEHAELEIRDATTRGQLRPAHTKSLLPPSTKSVFPVTNRDSSLAKKSTTFAISSGLPMMPREVIFFLASMNCAYS